MSTPEPEEYKNNFKWLEIIRRPPRKEVTPTEKIRREIVEAERLKHELIKTSEIDEIIPKLKEFIKDEEEAAKYYEELLTLFKRISIATGMLEFEGKVIEKILDDEVEHRKKLQRILDELTR